VTKGSLELDSPRSTRALRLRDEPQEPLGMQGVVSMNMFCMRDDARARRPQGCWWGGARSLAVLALAFGSQASAASIFTGNLVVSSLTYEGTSSTVTAGQAAPKRTNGPCVTAITNGSYGQVFQNDTVDANFGVTAPYALQFYKSNGKTATQTSTYNI